MEYERRGFTYANHSSRKLQSMFEVHLMSLHDKEVSNNHRSVEPSPAWLLTASTRLLYSFISGLVTSRQVLSTVTVPEGLLVHRNSLSPLLWISFLQDATGGTIMEYQLNPAFLVNLGTAEAESRGPAQSSNSL